MRVHPLLLAGARVERDHRAARAGRGVERALDHERRALELGLGTRTEVVGLEPPGDFELAEIGGVDLIEGRVLAAAQIGGVHRPLAVLRCSAGRCSDRTTAASRRVRPPAAPPRARRVKPNASWVTPDELPADGVGRDPAQPWNLRMIPLGAGSLPPGSSRAAMLSASVALRPGLPATSAHENGCPEDASPAPRRASLRDPFIPPAEPGRPRPAYPRIVEGERHPRPLFSTTLRTSAGSTGTQPTPDRRTSARQCCAVVTSPWRPRLRKTALARLQIRHQLPGISRRHWSSAPVRPRVATTIVSVARRGPPVAAQAQHCTRNR